MKTVIALVLIMLLVTGCVGSDDTVSVKEKLSGVTGNWRDGFFIGAFTVESDDYYMSCVAIIPVGFDGGSALQGDWSNCGPGHRCLDGRISKIDLVMPGE